MNVAHILTAKRARENRSTTIWQILWGKSAFPRFTTLSIVKAEATP